MDYNLDKGDTLDGNNKTITIALPTETDFTWFKLIQHHQQESFWFCRFDKPNKRPSNWYNDNQDDDYVQVKNLTIVNERDRQVVV